jgi:hypothetical protein
MCLAAPRRLIQLVRTTALFGTLILTIITSCSPPMNTEQAQRQLIEQGVFQKIQSPPNHLATYSVGLANLFQMHVVKSETACEGAIGSIVPPLAERECVER